VTKGPSGAASGRRSIAHVTDLDPDLDDFIEALPKVELHVHLVGSASPPTVLELATRYDDHRLPRTEDGLREFYEFRDFPHFIEVYEEVNDVVREPEDVADLVVGAARDLASQNARYVELTVTPYSHVRSTEARRGMSMPAVTEALDHAARHAEELGVRLGYVFDIDGLLGEPAARATLEHAVEHPPEALVGFGLGGMESARPEHRDIFRVAFGDAVAAGLHSVPHAGETTGPESIWEALDGLGAERIGHGIRCLDDPRLVDRLRAGRVPLEVCPTSNLRTRQVDRIEDHPFPKLIAEGLVVTLNSDDPPMFGTTLTNEFRIAAHTFGLGTAELAELSRTAVRSSFLDAVGKQEILAEINAVEAQRADGDD
jgi:aminodeoxyfutalosine deaminase